MTSAWMGERVRLRGAEPGDWEAFAAFDGFSDDQRNGWLVTPPRSAERARAWAKELAGQDPDLDEFRLVIADAHDDTPVGMINTHHADRVNGTFAYGIAIGNPHQRRGYAREAVALLLRYMFGERRFQKCDIEVYASNEGSLGLHEAMGFVTEGRRRRSRYAAGRYEDVVLLGITAEEFQEADRRSGAGGPAIG